MPEREFELYLSLLSRFLRLRPAQRDEVADELRDHLDQRLEELAARGLSREEAIHQALDEFGDAAELAKHFTQAAHVRRRRVIMRCTYGTIAALAASLLVATAFWPSSPEATLPSRSVAQELKRPSKVERVVASFPPQSRVEQKLSQRIEENVSIRGKKLTEVCREFEDRLGIDFRLDMAALEEAGQLPGSPIPDFALRHTALEARTVLKLLLEPLGLGVVVRDDLATITSAENARAEQDRMTFRIYNVRDLVPSPGGDAAVSTVTRRPALRGFAAVDSLPAANGSPDSAAVIESGSAAPLSVRIPQDKGAVQVLRQGFGTAPAAANSAPTSKDVVRQTRSALARLIENCVDPDQWEEVGGPCLITEIPEYPGLLFVHATSDVHQKVLLFLDETQAALRDALAAGNGRAASRPAVSRAVPNQNPSPPGGGAF